MFIIIELCHHYLINFAVKTRIYLQVPHLGRFLLRSQARVNTYEKTTLNGTKKLESMSLAINFSHSNFVVKTKIYLSVAPLG